MPGSAATLENYCDRKHGFMKVTVTRTKMTFSYFAVPDPNASQKKPLRPFDSITLPIGGTGF
jgi:hypothetical protein